MTLRHGDAVAVGVDGSEGARLATRWAATEADRRGLPLKVIHSWTIPLPPIGLGPTVMETDDTALQAAALSVLDDASAYARENVPNLDVQPELFAGSPSQALLAASETACVVALGSAGLSGFSELLLGSATLQVVTHAECPVAVIPDAERAATLATEPQPEAGRVVVGIDGSPVSVDAAAAAFEAASLRGVELTLLHAWNEPAYDASGLVLPDNFLFEEAEGEELRAVAETVAGLQEKYPDVHVRQRLEHGKPSRALTAASNGAELLVVGTRGHGGFAKLLLGSTSHAVLHRARCPVLVVRAR